MASELHPVRDRLRDSEGGSKKTCAGCVGLHEVADAVDSEIVDRREFREIVLAELQEIRVDLAAVKASAAAVTESVRHEMRSMLEVWRLQTAGKDPREVTPTSKWPTLKVGPASLRAPVWAVFLVAAMLVVTVSSAASVAYVASKWGPPAAAARK